MRYIKLNNEILKPSSTDIYSYEKDKEAVKAYFLDYVNKKTMFFHDLKEKLDYLFENDYYEKELFDQYTFEEVKAVYQQAYAKKFRFPSYMSASKFYKDYALKTNDGENILERYEDRIAVNALLFAKGDGKKALDFVDLLINQEYQPATPTFLNAGRKRRGELVSCFLLEVGDSLNDINMAESTAKQLSKVGGGVSLNLSNIRAKGESIKGIANVAKGVASVSKGLDHAFRYADQMGQRPGAGAVFLNAFHADINSFLDMKKISADEDIRVKTLSIGVIIPNKLIELARDNKPMYVFYPHTVYEATGEHFGEINITERYDELVANPLIRKDKINPRQLLEKMSALRFESGYPYEFFVDNANKVHALDGTVNYTNLCTEIMQKSRLSTYTDYGQEDIIGLDISCNLGSLNIANVMENKDIERSVALSVDALTTVSDLTSIKNAPAVERANEEMHSIGLGAMNLHGYLAVNSIDYESQEAIEFADVFFAAVNYYSIKRSMEIVEDTEEVFEGFEKSKYADGTYFNAYVTQEYLPISDKVKKLFEGIKLPTIADWLALSEQVQKNGMYHAYRLAIAPNGSSSYIQSSTASVMPIMERIEERTYGNGKTYYPMPNLSFKTWAYYKEAYDMDMKRVIDVVSTIQQHVDQGISLTLFMKDTHTTRDLTKIDLYAHYKGIKSLYYARTKDTTSELCVSCTV